MRHTLLEHRFVQSIPRKLEAGVLYISMEHGTVIHSCCCGCGEEVVTPLTPTDWQLTYDGESMSLTPSIGNWQLACRSHYVINRNRVIEAEPWTQAQVVIALERDRMAKDGFYGIARSALEAEPGATPVPVPAVAPDHIESSNAAFSRIRTFWSWLYTCWR